MENKFKVGDKAIYFDEEIIAEILGGYGVFSKDIKKGHDLNNTPLVEEVSSENKILPSHQVKEWLLANCINEFGDLDLGYLDFSDFDGDVCIDNLTVKKDLYLNNAKVKGSIYQEDQKAGQDIFQGEQEFGGVLLTQNTSGLIFVENWDMGVVYKNKKEKLTLEEIEEKLGFKVELVDAEDKEILI